MPLPDMDSSVGHSFGLEFDGIQIKSIIEVSGLKMEQDVIEYKSNSNDGKYSIRKQPGRWKAGECTLTRPLTEDHSFDKWVKDSQLGKLKDVSKGGAIIVYDYEGNAVKRYKVTNAWPTQSGMLWGLRTKMRSDLSWRHVRFTGRRGGVIT